MLQIYIYMEMSERKRIQQQKTCKDNKIQVLCTADEDKINNKPSELILAEWLTFISTTNANVSTITIAILANKLLVTRELF